MLDNLYPVVALSFLVTAMVLLSHQVPTAAIDLGASNTYCTRLTLERRGLATADCNN